MAILEPVATLTIVVAAFMLVALLCNWSYVRDWFAGRNGTNNEQ